MRSLGKTQVTPVLSDRPDASVHSSQAGEVRLTPLRRRVLDALVAADPLLGAYDLAERVSRPDRRIPPVSIYRVLAVLTQLGLVRRIVTRNAYLARKRREQLGEAALCLICRSCGRVEETISAEIERGLGRALSSSGFCSLDRTLEIEGECAGCRGDTTSKELDHALV